ncbi:helix-turn-helix domain-containing protein [Streptomyces luteogriseus]|uniref:helix-turn-helix domain-containing protein n=1 Tax=Streptomyces luteogriseus TaxID=68233 RepID=UPI0037A0E967
MGRSEKPIASTGKARHALALWLRAQRESAELTYERLAARTIFSPDTLRRAASGQQIPKLTVLKAFAEACGADLQVAEGLWRAARRELGGRHVEIHVAYTTDFSDLHDAMVSLYRQAGSPSYSELDRQAGGNGKLPKSTLSRFFSKKATPSRAFTLAFAEACGVRGERLEHWDTAWQRAAGKYDWEKREKARQRERAKRIRRKRERIKFSTFARCAGCHRHELASFEDPSEIFWCDHCVSAKIPLPLRPPR